MTDEDAYNILGVPVGATMAQIKAAYCEARAKALHPDYNDAPEASAQFQPVQEAYRRFLGGKPKSIVLAGRSRGDEANGHGPDAGDGSKGIDPIAVARAFMARAGLAILFDGSIHDGTRPPAGYGSSDLESWLTRGPSWTMDRLLDEVMLEIRHTEVPLSTSDVSRALRKVAREDQQDRANFVMRPFVFAELNEAEQAEANTSWRRLVGSAFYGEPALGVAILQHFIWQVKRKQLERTVHHHLMPVIVSPGQGTGKTTFVRHFLAPLQELATASALLSDLADRRSGDVYRYPVAFVDDVERLDPGDIAALKSIMSAEAIIRRMLGSSRSEKRSQLTTLIGTANEPVHMLITDPTGLRRFAELPFRNGAVAKGGDDAVWRVVEETDYTLLWRSVDGFGPSPIEPHLAALAAMQEAAAPADRFRDCLVKLDVRSEAVLNISDRPGVRADNLRLLFCAWLGEEITANRFSQRMAELVGDPRVPLKPKIRAAKGYFYPVKYPLQRDGEATQA